MLAKYFSIVRNYVLSVSLQRKYNFYHQNALLDAFRMSSGNVIGRNLSLVIPLLANQDLTPMLIAAQSFLFQFMAYPSTLVKILMMFSLWGVTDVEFLFRLSFS